MAFEIELPMRVEKGDDQSENVKTIADKVLSPRERARASGYWTLEQLLVCRPPAS